MVKLGLLYDQLRPDERLIIDAAKREGIDLTLYDTDQLAWDITSEDDGIKLADAFLQRCMSYFRSIHVTAALEGRGKTVVNSYRASSTCGNKLIASIALKRFRLLGRLSHSHRMDR